MMMNHIKITSQEPPVDIAGSWIVLQGHSLVYADLIRIKKKNAHKVSLELRNTLTAQEIKQYEINLISEPTFEEDTTVSIYDSNANLELFFSPSFAPPALEDRETELASYLCPRSLADASFNWKIPILPTGKAQTN
jgi:hypothetical protein